MLCSYIYGNVSGFVIEGQPEKWLKDYLLQQFYNNELSGRYLTIEKLPKRKLTMYSYHVHGIYENNYSRKGNGVFGITVAVDNGEFCPGFKELLQKFDTLYNNVLTDGILLKKEKEVISFQISKFEDETSYVENVKRKAICFFEECGFADLDDSFSYSDGESTLSDMADNELIMTYFKIRQKVSIVSSPADTKTAKRISDSHKKNNIEKRNESVPAETEYENGQDSNNATKEKEKVETENHNSAAQNTVQQIESEKLTSQVKKKEGRFNGNKLTFIAIIVLVVFFVVVVFKNTKVYKPTGNAQQTDSVAPPSNHPDWSKSVATLEKEIEVLKQRNAELLKLLTPKEVESDNPTKQNLIFQDYFLEFDDTEYDELGISKIKLTPKNGKNPILIHTKMDFKNNKCDIGIYINGALKSHSEISLK